MLVKPCLLLENSADCRFNQARYRVYGKATTTKRLRRMITNSVRPNQEEWRSRDTTTELVLELCEQLSVLQYLIRGSTNAYMISEIRMKIKRNALVIMEPAIARG